MVPRNNFISSHRIFHLNLSIMPIMIFFNFFKILFNFWEDLNHSIDHFSRSTCFLAAGFRFHRLTSFHFLLHSSLILTRTHFFIFIAHILNFTKIFCQLSMLNFKYSVSLSQFIKFLMSIFFLVECRDHAKTYKYHWKKTNRDGNF